MSSSDSSDGKKGGDWTGCLHYYVPNNWLQFENLDALIRYFRYDLGAEEENIIFAEIRKYTLSSWFTKIPIVKDVVGECGYWHEYTIVETTNWYWSFEKTKEGLYVQRSKNKNDVQSYNGSNKRPTDREEGRSSHVSFGENIMDAVQWIINRGELDCEYHVFERNCHHFASLIYEAITKTAGRSLFNTH